VEFWGVNGGLSPKAASRPGDQELVRNAGVSAPLRLVRTRWSPVDPGGEHPPTERFGEGRSEDGLRSRPHSGLVTPGMGVQEDWANAAIQNNSFLRLSRGRPGFQQTSRTIDLIAGRGPSRRQSPVHALWLANSTKVAAAGRDYSNPRGPKLALRSKKAPSTGRHPPTHAVQSVRQGKGGARPPNWGGKKRLGAPQWHRQAFSRSHGRVTLA